MELFQGPLNLTKWLPTGSANIPVGQSSSYKATPWGNEDYGAPGAGPPLACISFSLLALPQAPIRTTVPARAAWARPAPPPAR